VSESELVAHRIGKSYDVGCIDSVDVESSGLIRVNAWTAGDPSPLLALTVLADQRDLPMAHWYRTYRPDVARELQIGDEFLGVTMEYVAATDSIQTIVLRLANDAVELVNLAMELRTPAYGNLFTDGRVLRRDDIYSHGPPSAAPSAEVLSMASTLPGPVLDFGCGAGSLVRELRSNGMDAHGIDLRTGEISAAIGQDVMPHVTLYDGDLPLPFPDKLFASSTMIDVMEHLEDFDSVLEELRRLTREQVLITVPDMSAVPLCAPHGVVPWHLLEGTHKQFFTQSSLSAAVRRHFRNFQIYRFHPLYVNGTRMYVNLAARCWI
jgi:2-polyprenyl-3-methyl-5-hydroxy-6-metoxy-1,4-benzoquinol methylase